MISIRSTAAIGIALRFAEAPPSVGEPGKRRPFRSTSVRREPAPRRLIVACDCAELPERSENEPKEFSELERSASATVKSPSSLISAAVIETTGAAPSRSVRLIREPVTSIFSTATASCSSCA